MRLQLSTWPDVQAYLRDSDAIVLPLGSTEQHGPSGLIGTDALVAEAIAWRAAEQHGRMLVAPTLACTPAQFNLGFAGTISVRAVTFVQVLVDVVESLARSGFRRFYLLNGHGANLAPARAAMHDLHQQRSLARGPGDGLRFRLRSWWEYPATDSLRRRLYGRAEGMHATPSEVAVTRSLHPHIDPQVTLSAAVLLEPAFLRDHAGDAHDDAHAHRHAFADGRVGSDPSLATPADGAALLASAASELAADFSVFTDSTT